MSQQERWSGIGRALIVCFAIYGIASLMYDLRHVIEYAIEGIDNDHTK